MHRKITRRAALIWCAMAMANPLDTARAAQHTIDDLLRAIRTVETGGQPNDGRDAIGDNGRSIGPLQIGRAYWTDSRVPGKWEDVRDLAYAQRVTIAYWRRYAPAALQSLDLETLARVHNGGPSGHRKTATMGYWRKVRAALDK